MKKNSKIQKLPQYSIDKLRAGSDLAKRGLDELGLLRNEKHYTIIYTCQFCGRLINYASTPCLFCGKYPKTKKQVIKSQALSSISLDMTSLLFVSKEIKSGKNLEEIIVNINDLVRNVLSNENDFPIFKSLFKIMGNLNNDPENTNFKRSEILSRSNIVCENCNHEISVADFPCLYCGVLAQRQGIDAKTLEIDYSPVKKWIIALNNILLFVEKYLDMGENEDALTELIFVLVYVINRLIEKNELPDMEVREYLIKLFNEARYFGSSDLEIAVEIENNKVAADMDGKTEGGESEYIIMALASNISLILNTNNKQRGLFS